MANRQVNAVISFTERACTGSTTQKITDTLVKYTSTGAARIFTLLPAASWKKQVIKIQPPSDCDSDAYFFTIKGDGSELIGGSGGANTLICRDPKGTIELRSNGTSIDILINGSVSPNTHKQSPLGTTPVSTVTIAEFGNGRQRTTVLTLTNFIVGALAGDTTNIAIGNKIYTFPAGNHFLRAAYKNIQLKCAGTAVAFDCGVGSIVGTGAQNVLSGVGATAEDYLTGVATTSGTSYGTAVEQLAGVSAAIATNATGSIKDVFLNAATTPNANNTGNLLANGTIVLSWDKMGS